MEPLSLYLPLLGDTETFVPYSVPADIGLQRVVSR